MSLPNTLPTDETVRLNELNELKNTFIALVSHELRTPLGVVNGYLDVGLQELGDASPQAREYFEQAQKSAARLTRIVQELTDFARLQSGKPVDVMDPIPISEALSQVYAFLRANMESKSLKFSVSISPEIAHLRYDGESLLIILRNLLSNAAKFSAEGGNIWIAATHLENDEKIVIAINDNAPPIPLEKQKNIFEDFRQIENHLTRRYEGLGLGLAVARRAARVLDGDLSLRVREDGNTFVLMLPYIDNAVL